MSQGFNNLASSRKSVSYLFQNFFKEERLYIGLYIQGKSIVKLRFLLTFFFFLEIGTEQDNFNQKINQKIRVKKVSNRKCKGQVIIQITNELKKNVGKESYSHAF